MQAVSAPVQVSVVVIAPSPPPPMPPPSPPQPGAPVIGLYSTSDKAMTGIPTSQGAVPEEDANMVASLVIGTIFAIVMVICFPIGAVLLVLWVRKKRKAKIEAQKAYWLSIVPEMVDAETQCSDAGSDDEEGGFMTGLGDIGAGALGVRSRVQGLMENTAESMGRGLMDTTADSIMENTTESVGSPDALGSPDAQRDRVAPPTSSGQRERAPSPKGSVMMTL